MIGYTLQEYWDMLDKHDWYFMFSDDRHVYEKGWQAENRLLKLAEDGGEEYRELFNGFQKHYFSGEPWVNEKQPRPERPVHE
jgi:hypothetical protein